MVTKKTLPTAPRALLQILAPREDAKEQLQSRIEKGREIRGSKVTTEEDLEAFKNTYSKWNSFNNQLLHSLFSTDELQAEYKSASAIVAMVVSRSYGPSLNDRTVEVYKALDKKIHSLDSIVERLEILPSTTNTTIDNDVETNSQPPLHSTKVFVVHGRDQAAKADLEVFLRENNLEPIVLHRQADSGMTIIEKFEKHSDVGYAFILLTPDEIAYLAADEKKPDDERQKGFRARQNVNFEFGYFIGKLGRSRVCCLYTGDVEIPSDLSGLVYKKYQKEIEEVGYAILKDLRAAGYPV